MLWANAQTNITVMENLQLSRQYTLVKSPGDMMSTPHISLETEYSVFSTLTMRPCSSLPDPATISLLEEFLKTSASSKIVY